MGTKIEWCDETINPIQDKRKGTSGRGYHCTKCSPGCLNCYAERINTIRGNGLPFDDAAVEFELIGSELEKPLKWKKPRSIFVQSMGDLFHEAVPWDFRDKAYAMMQKCDQHTYLVLSKRPEGMLNYILSAMFDENCNYDGLYEEMEALGIGDNAPLADNVCHGLTVCNQQEADEKIPIFLQVPGKRFLSIEPMLGPIDISWPLDHPQRTALSQIDAVILGGETLGRRPGREMKIEWAESVVDQCDAAGVPVFVKQLHINGRVSKDMNEWPEKLRRRELPWLKKDR